MIGDRIRALRQAQDLSQAKLAAVVNITETSINNYETGRRNPSPKILLQLARVFGVSSEYLLGFTDNPARQTSLPTDWEQTVAWVMSQGLSPSDIKTAVKLLQLYQTETSKQEGV